MPLKACIWTSEQITSAAVEDRLVNQEVSSKMSSSFVSRKKEPKGQFAIFLVSRDCLGQKTVPTTLPRHFPLPLNLHPKLLIPYRLDRKCL